MADPLAVRPFSAVADGYAGTLPSVGHRVLHDAYGGVYASCLCRSVLSQPNLLDLVGCGDKQPSSTLEADAQAQAEIPPQPALLSSQGRSFCLPGAVRV